MSLQKNCQEKQRLVKNYSVAVEHYSLAVHALVNSASIEDREMYKETSRAVGVAQESSANAHQKLEDHRAEHGC